LIEVEVQFGPEVLIAYDVEWFEFVVEFPAVMGKPEAGEGQGTTYTYLHLRVP